MSKFVISTLSADNRYTNWTTNGGVNMEGRSVLVRGGAGIAARGGGKNVVTPRGVRTEVSDAEAEFLAAHPHFKEHAKNGFVRIVNSAQEPDKAAKSMEKDASGPKTDKDVAEDAKRNDKGDGTPPIQAVTNKK